MRLLLAALAVAALAACSGSSGAPVTASPDGIGLQPPSPMSWTTASLDGRFTVRQTEGCRLTGLEGTVERWSADACVAAADDLRFLSPDGDRLLVLHPLPEGTAGRDWSRATVARILVRGAEVRRFSGADLVAPASIADMSHDYSWLRGVGSAGGSAPRAVDGGTAIAMEVVDGSTLRLAFDGSGAPERPARAASLAAGGAAGVPSGEDAYSPEADEVTTWRWEDGDGNLHFSLWNQVPHRFRQRASPVTAEVGSYTANRSSGGAASAAALSWWAAQQRTSEAARKPTEGPKLNGLTDAQRHDQEMARLQLQRVNAMNDEALARERVRRNNEAAFNQMVNRAAGGR